MPRDIYYYTKLTTTTATTNNNNNKQALLLSVLAIAVSHHSGLYSTLAILEPRWWPCQIQVLGPKLTGGALGPWRQIGRCPPKTAHFVPQTAFFGSKWAPLSRLSTPNGLRSFLGKHIFDPCLMHFCPQNGPFSRLFGTLEGPKCPETGSKWAGFTCLCTPNEPRSLLEKCVFDPFLTHFWPQNCPFSRHSGIFQGPKRVTTGSKRAQNTCLSIPSGLGTTLEKKISLRGP